MRVYPESAKILQHNRRFVPGGVVSSNRAAKPEIVFTKGEGAHLWDAEGNRYADYHAAFGPHILGHNHPAVTEAVEKVLRDGASLYGSGTTALEGELAELVCTAAGWMESVQFLNSGSEATYQAIRLARAVTGRDHVIVMQGGYNGWHNDVACNLMTPLDHVGPRVSPGEYAFSGISGGIPQAHAALVHPVNFNDLASVEYVCRRYPVAALITEPILQNIGIVHPRPGYLQGLRALADRLGFLLIFDEVKTGFRHALGGYAEVSGVRPDLAVYGKALANGYPIAAVGGRRDLMDYVVHPDPVKRVLIAGTYNAHPVPTAAAIATVRLLMADNGVIFDRIGKLGARMQKGLEDVCAAAGVKAVIARECSAFCPYFMDHAPVDWHDIAAHHDFELDSALRQLVIDAGVYTFPIAVKQWSISAAHTAADIEETIDVFARALANARIPA